jgi:superfamily II DNA or RNA helicase
MFARDGGVLISPLDKESQKTLKRKLKAPQDDIDTFNSFSTKQHRAEVMTKLREGKINRIFSTYSLFNKGIDVDTLELLYFCAPTKSEIRVLQSKGRIVRKKNDGTLKEPKIIHIFDENVDLLKWQGISVHNLLRKSNKI